MQNTDWSKVASHAVVSVAAGLFISKVFGPKTGMFGALLAVAAHEMFDAPLASYLDRTLRA